MSLVESFFFPPLLLLFRTLSGLKLLLNLFHHATICLMIPCPSIKTIKKRINLSLDLRLVAGFFNQIFLKSLVLTFRLVFMDGNPSN